jgi:aspartate aminotransferase
VVCPELADRVLTVSGVSKSHAMTGFRIGVSAGPEWLIEAMGKLQSHSSGNPSSISQAAAVAAFEGPQDFLLDWRDRFRARRDAGSGGDQRDPRPLDPGARWRILLHGRCRAADGAVRRMIRPCACTCSNTAWRSFRPAAFGSKDGFRISFAADDCVLNEAVRRIAEALT